MNLKAKQELVVATKNIKKFKEIKDILRGVDIKISSLAEYPDAPRIIENGKSFEENAAKKALKIARFTGKLTLGEDSGLCVDVLNGEPGIRSSRFSGKDKNDKKNNLKLLKLLQGLSPDKRRAHYYCAVALADKEGIIGITNGKCHGIIGYSEKGKCGFGYDPLFIIPKYKKTFGQLGEVIKHKMSHRFKALHKAKRLIITYLSKNP
ncbi:MAG: RdgB/HAM1 family non-canonical purine NTP pyrophosphatase [Candidatus Omnitrophota bacterium]|jgi:XTP/dITP diphosphohydrolase|nr:MAG: RdgB/HAM1 family non-canonical purine NTP pyrophosphatase [Candidatus Omnitrophota bacterium]